MPRAKKRHTPLSALRITAYVKQKFDGNTKAAALALNVEYTMLWRAATGMTRRGPSIEVIEALVAHSGVGMTHWTGRSE